jgi:Flp pilus assembly protein TadD
MDDGREKGLLDAAIEAQRTGRLSEAESICRKILAEKPRDPAALHLLGVIAYQVGKCSLAEDLIRRAIAVRGTPSRCGSISARTPIARTQIGDCA